MILKFFKIGVDNMTEMNVATNDQVEAKINDKESIILDVREPAEYAMQHIPNSTLIPLGELENRLDEIDKDKTVYVICRTGNRRDRKSTRLNSSHVAISYAVFC